MWPTAVRMHSVEAAGYVALRVQVAKSHVLAGKYRIITDKAANTHLVQCRFGSNLQTCTTST